MGADWREFGDAAVEELEGSYEDQETGDEDNNSDDNDLRFSFLGILFRLFVARSTASHPGRDLLGYASFT